ncbi:hypothetical protein L1987_56450 [Smallanthus sonchifolius]|uniref:Uncharacterized protein n=1 Tax=Smallanthus sonchifolius TaxID=185202 RepID=A0ACB9EDG9_9ASTR|nr:hypothetical protein L1987_56450 [Smallanthus sonchifolius]
MTVSILDEFFLCFCDFAFLLLLLWFILQQRANLEIIINIIHGDVKKINKIKILFLYLVPYQNGPYEEQLSFFSQTIDALLNIKLYSLEGSFRD